ncbi:MAG TPA: N-acetylmuramoyl-L-alanine amidase [Bacteroidales bacterium]|jgi:hypothetical protein|nr:N-acetylmuramoyl-L-alanine amidase [Bacteroidales bacterium]HQJ82770.1 N-acetylmuramoyl-L-alanine amidase [Bacteroidales bacterium]
MKTCFFKSLTFLTILFLLNESPAFAQSPERLQAIASEKLKKWENPLVSWQHIAVPQQDSLKIAAEEKRISLFFDPRLQYYPFREESCNLFRYSLKKSLGRKFRNYEIRIFTNNYELEQLVPNYFRKSLPVDTERLPVARDGDKRVLVRNTDRIYPSMGLSGNSIALWHSHGYYYEMNLDRWEFQRAKLFGTVEDITVMGYVVPYLTPMLENAGANVFLPRERDIQINEVIVDNDWSHGRSELILMPDPETERVNTGFLLTDTLFSGFNPFRHGTSLRIKKDSAVYVPDIPENGSYAVYVSYPLMEDNSGSVMYAVNHTGGSTRFMVDQTMGGETWIYLGTFLFRKGKNIAEGSVSVKNAGNDGGPVALDAVKFGGGMGNVARKPSAEIIKNLQSAVEQAPGSVTGNISGDNSRFGWKISGKPRFLEGARYYLQYAGMPDTLVYSPNACRNDYNDDYQSRSLWVNYLMGEPFPDDRTQAKGLGIPLDLSLAFHTDAGITPGDSIIGTLAIYSTASDEGKFPDGSSRLASRDLSDIVQTQIVEDIRKMYNPEWTRRGLWDRPYYEARKPDIPAMLLELLSHQNLADLKYGLDPKFRFDVSRAVYKGILKYLAWTEGRDYVVQPLPVKDFAIMPAGEKTVRLSWKPVTDENEPSSVPERYRVYMRIGGKGFDNGTLTGNAFYEFEIDSLNTVYSFKVTALNEGGESFDSEILSVGFTENSTSSLLIVNGFDRVSGPAWFDNGKHAGIEWWKDRGVPDHYDFITIGDQHDFQRSNPWLDDDSPGWGASYSDRAGTVTAGNTFDYPYIHGKAALEAGHSFCSVSGSYFCSPDASFSDFKIVDLIFGEQKSTAFFGDTSRMRFRIYTPEFMSRIKELTGSGTSLFMSGSYVGSDLLGYNDSTAVKFAAEYLRFMPRTSHAARTGKAYATDYAKPFFSGLFRFNTDLSGRIYQVEAPDAIEPHGKDALCAFRYSESNASAGVMSDGKYRTVILSFPFETITSEKERTSLMKQILEFLTK